MAAWMSWSTYSTGLFNEKYSAISCLTEGMCRRLSATGTSVTYFDQGQFKFLSLTVLEGALEWPDLSVIE